MLNNSVLVLAGLLAALVGGAQAATCTSNGAGTNWGTAANWTCDTGAVNKVPAAGDAAVIASNMTVNTTTSLLSSLTISAGRTLSIGNSTTVRTINVAGDITVGGTMSVPTNSNATHILNAGGNISNSGTINFRSDGNSLCNVVFNKNGNQTVSGAGAYNFNRITLTMGATANILDMQSTMTAPAGFLTITSGTYRHSNISNITPWTADPNIPLNGRFWLNSAATVSTGAFSVSLNGGGLQVSAGTMNIGTGNGHLLRLRNSGSTLLLVEGGALNVSGGIKSNTNTDAGTYTQTAGTVTVATVTGGAAESFMLGSASIFNMSGGSLVFQGASGTNDLDIRSGAQNATGGTVQIGNASTAAGSTYWLTNTTGAALNIWNLLLNTTNSPTTRIFTATSVLNDLTIQSGATLQDNGFDIAVGAGNSTGNWTNSGTFSATTGTVTFTGTSPAQAISGGSATTFNNMVVDKAANNLTITTTPTVNGTLTFTKGKIVTGANRVILGTAATIAAPSAVSYVVGSLQKDYNAAAALGYSPVNSFPVGDASNYTPVQINAGTTSTAGSLTVNTTAGSHPQVTSPPGSSQGIDPAKALNRYWTLQACGLNTTAAPVDATFTFVAGDVPAGAAPANFILQKWNGSIWSPSMLVSAGATAIEAKNIDITAGAACPAYSAYDIGVGEALAGVTSAPGDFNAFETGTSSGSVNGAIHTKLAGTQFGVRLVRNNRTNNNLDITYNQSGVTVELVDSSDNTGTLASATACRNTWAAIPGTSQIVSFASGIVSAANFAINNAYKDVRVHIVKTGTGSGEGCSTDPFSIRPTGFTSINSNMNNPNNPGPSGSARAVAGSGTFTLIAATGLSKYAGTPKIDNASLQAHAGAKQIGTVSGTFPPALSGTSTGTSAFTYSEVGNFRLLGYDPLLDPSSARGVYDDTFSAVDQPYGCTSDFSNSLVGSVYGCKFGLTANSTYFGRFYPKDFVLTTGTLTNRLSAGCSPVSAYTYAGEQLQVTFTLTARNGAAVPVTTQNYDPTAGFAFLDGGTISNFRFGAIDLADAIAPTTATTLTSKLTPGTSSGIWASGVGSFTAALMLTRGGAAEGPYESLNLGIDPTDPTDSDVKLNSYDLDTSVPSDTNDHGLIGATRIRYGRLRIDNAYGSQLLALPMKVAAQYWNSGAFVTNTDDGCTSIASTNLTVTAGSGATINTTIPAGTNTLSSGAGAITLTKPTGIYTGKGSVLVSPNNNINPYLPGTTGTGRATFGIYKAGPIIYQREIYY